ncbi:10559_t:CDS:2 [Funneliformis geosporum]|nr:10559_t:CDS:2 [Funneliformis geosporum]
MRTKAATTAGLLKPTDVRFEETSKLVYQVHPLPDQILDYVWDYGTLKPIEERKYIEIMVQEQLKELGHLVFSDCLFESQEFIRKCEESYSVSLRDVKRAITLVKFFKKSFEGRPPIKKYDQKPKKYPQPSDISINVRSCVLALGLCYQSRLYEQKLRTDYRKKMGEVFKKHKININEDRFSKILREEQDDYVDRMQCPPNTAKNEALLENVLVMIVCILTKIPCFIIGAPGSSKSLAVRLISQNLRGSDSNDEYFRKLPQVYLIPHQGSSSSTSEGIIKVFDKAVNFQDTSSEEFPVISVVLLDEVGLAEKSPFNPLKVLHSLLEPSYPDTEPKVSCVAISNWRLDNMMDENKLEKADPPLLNRFEKQRMVMSDTLTSQENELVEALKEWTELISTITDNNFNINFNLRKFKQKDLFIGFDENETLQNYNKKFISNIEKSPIIKNSPIANFPNKYFKDFINVILTNEANNINEKMEKGIEEKLLKFIFERRLGVENVLNPIRLHSYWWKNSSSILAELALAKMIPDIIIQIEKENDDNLLSDVDFEKYLVEQPITYNLLDAKDFDAESEKETHRLVDYMIDMSLNLWPSNNDIEEVLNQLFPQNLLVSNSLAAYEYVLQKKKSMGNKPIAINTFNSQTIASSSLDIKSSPSRSIHSSRKGKKVDRSKFDAM